MHPQCFAVHAPQSALHNVKRGRAGDLFAPLVARVVSWQNHGNVWTFAAQSQTCCSLVTWMLRYCQFGLLLSFRALFVVRFLHWVCCFYMVFCLHQVLSVFFLLFCQATLPTHPVSPPPCFPPPNHPLPTPSSPAPCLPPFLSSVFSLTALFSVCVSVCFAVLQFSPFFCGAGVGVLFLSVLHISTDPPSAPFYCIAIFVNFSSFFILIFNFY